MLGELEHLRRTYARLSAEYMDLYRYWTRLSNGEVCIFVAGTVCDINIVEREDYSAKVISYDMDKTELSNHIEELNVKIIEIKNKIQEISH